MQSLTTGKSCSWRLPRGESDGVYELVAHGEVASVLVVIVVFQVEVLHYGDFLLVVLDLLIVLNFGAIFAVGAFVCQKAFGWAFFVLADEIQGHGQCQRRDIWWRRSLIGFLLSILSASGFHIWPICHEISVDERHLVLQLFWIARTLLSD